MKKGLQILTGVCFSLLSFANTGIQLTSPALPGSLYPSKIVDSPTSTAMLLHPSQFITEVINPIKMPGLGKVSSVTFAIPRASMSNNLLMQLKEPIILNTVSRSTYTVSTANTSAGQASISFILNNGWPSNIASDSDTVHLTLSYETEVIDFSK